MKFIPPHLEVPHTTNPPAVDGTFSMAPWSSAAVIPALPASLKTHVQRAAFPTTVRVLWDPIGLYVRFECEAEEIYAPYQGRDKHHWNGDVVEVFLDPVGDGMAYAELQVTPTNQIFDQMIVLSSAPDRDESGYLREDFWQREVWKFPEWDMPGLRTAATITTEGWIAELAIPAAPILQRLNRTTLAPMTLRAHFMRYDWCVVDEHTEERKLLAMNWSDILHGMPHRSAARMGKLQLIP